MSDSIWDRYEWKTETDAPLGELLARAVDRWEVFQVFTLDKPAVLFRRRCRCSSRCPLCWLRLGPKP